MIFFNKIKLMVSLLLFTCFASATNYRLTPEQRPMYIGPDTIRTITGVVAEGDIANIIEYKWIDRKGETLRDINNHEIIYTNYANNTHKIKGTKRITFVVKTKDGRTYTKRPYAPFIVALPLRPRASADIFQLGETVTLLNRIRDNSGYQVRKIRWLENGSVLTDVDGKKMSSKYKKLSYYKPTRTGKHTLTFEATSTQGTDIKFTKTVSFTVIPKDVEKLTLSPGSFKVIRDGEHITLNGRITKGNINNIEKYSWSEKGKILKNLLNDEILYYDYENRENDYRPTVGRHVLDFNVVDIHGTKYTKSVLIVVKYKEDDIEVSIGEDKNITLGNRFIFKDRIIRGERRDIEYYTLSKDGKIIERYSHTAGFRDYTPTSVGTYIITFTAFGNNGKEYKDSMILTVKPKGGQSSRLKVYAGKNQTIKLGDFVTLNGHIKKEGSIVKNNNYIDYYSWTKNGKVIKNLEKDDILYYTYKNRDNDYRPTTVGKHKLTLTAFANIGKKYKDSIIVTVKPQDENKFKFKVEEEMTVNLGDVVLLNGLVTEGNKQNIENYRWTEYGKVVNNMLGDPILYWDYSNRENDYKPRTKGRHTLVFKVIDNDGKEYKTTRVINVK